MIKMMRPVIGIVALAVVVFSDPPRTFGQTGFEQLMQAEADLPQ